MKNLFLTLILLFSVSSFAEMKPEWSIVPDLCGKNTSFFAVDDSPTSACIASVTGQDDLQVVYFTYENMKTKYFLVTDKVERMGADTLTIELVDVINHGGYALLNDLVDHGEIYKVTTSFGRKGMTLKGNGFEGELEIVFVTQSIGF